ncbi:MAG: glutaredoxin family protein [Labilithrix sp.]|nr:glutaredoxin family protein [Labilithrix sp.]
MAPGRMDRQRCAWHGLILDDTGRCSRCRGEATRQNARTIYALAGAITLAAAAALVGWKLVATQAPVAARQLRDARTAPLHAPAPTSPTEGAAADDDQARLAATREVSVVIYTADYCGWCRKTKAWLDQRGIPYTERRVDVDRSAQREMKSKFRGGGIPAIDIEGELRQGFDPAWLERTIRARASVRAGPG